MPTSFSRHKSLCISNRLNSSSQPSLQVRAVTPYEEAMVDAYYQREELVNGINCKDHTDLNSERMPCSRFAERGAVGCSSFDPARRKLSNVESQSLNNHFGSQGLLNKKDLYLSAISMQQFEEKETPNFCRKVRDFRSPMHVRSSLRDQCSHTLNSRTQTFDSNITSYSGPQILSTHRANGSRSITRNYGRKERKLKTLRRDDIKKTRKQVRISRSFYSIFIVA